MGPLNRCLTSLLLGTLAVLAGTPGLAAKAQPPELKKVRALLVVDTDTNLRESVQVDRDRMIHLLLEGIPKDRLDLAVLDGKNATPGRVLQHYRSLPQAESDTLLFFYAGHGATIDGKHVLAFQEGKGGFLDREELLRTMTARKPALAVLLTDCCSNPIKIAKKTKTRALPRPARELSPTLRCLLFQHRGVVNITAATDSVAWGDEEDGGIFTRTLQELATGKLEALDDDHDGFVAWKEFFPHLQRQTDETFRTWRREQQARGEKVSAASQRPRAFQLPGDAVVAGPVRPADRPRTYAVVTLVNTTDMPVDFEFRWDGEGRWEKSTLPPRVSRAHFRTLADAARDQPHLEVKFGTQTRTLAAGRWTGSSPPGPEAGRKYGFGQSTKNRDLEDDKPAPQEEKP